jgi:hypothetical protein
MGTVIVMAAKRKCIVYRLGVVASTLKRNSAGAVYSTIFSPAKHTPRPALTPTIYGLTCFSCCLSVPLAMPLCCSAEMSTLSMPSLFATPVSLGCLIRIFTCLGALPACLRMSVAS